MSLMKEGGWVEEKLTFDKNYCFSSPFLQVYGVCLCVCIRVQKNKTKIQYHVYTYKPVKS